MDEKFDYNDSGEKRSDHEDTDTVNFVMHDSPHSSSEEDNQEENYETGYEEDSAQTQDYEEYDNNPEMNTYDSNGVPQAKEHKTFKKIMKCIAYAALFGIVACVVFQTGNFIVGKAFRKQNPTIQNHTSDVNTTKVTKNSTTVTSDVTEIVKNAMPSVVSITNMSVQEARDYFGGIHQTENQSSGSGIIVGKNDTELLILTNNHVIEGSSKLTVSFIDHESVEGVVKGTDANRDIAIVAVPLEGIKKETMDQIAVATIGDSTKLQVGEPAIAIGNALGYGQSVTTGIISATNRELNGFDGKLIQTDAAINPGNSGGALLNANGEVVGVNTVKINMEAVEGIGYAIPLSDISDLLEVLMNKETRTKVEENQRGYIGITGFDVTEESAQMYNMPIGVYVSEVLEHGGADQAGVIKGSIITGFEGIEIQGMEALQAQLQYYKAGEKVKVTLQVPADKGSFEEKTIEIKLQKRE